MFTLGQIATLTLVSAIGTIGCIVAHRGDVNTTFCHTRTLPLTVRALEGRWHTGMFGTLIRVIATIVLAIADVRLEHTICVVALEEILRTSDLSTILLVRVIRAIIGAIAVPGNGYTEPSRFATEMLLEVALIRSHRGATELIAAIITVRYAIAFV